MTEREILFKKIGYIYEVLDDLFLSDRFEEAQEFVFSFDLKSITSEEILALMTMVRQVEKNRDQDKFPRAREFIGTAATEIKSRYPEQEWNSILRGLV